MPETATCEATCQTVDIELNAIILAVIATPYSLLSKESPLKGYGAQTHTKSVRWNGRNWTVRAEKYQGENPSYEGRMGVRLTSTNVLNPMDQDNYWFLAEAFDSVQVKLEGEKLA